MIAVTDISTIGFILVCAEMGGIAMDAKYFRERRQAAGPIATTTAAGEIA